MKVNNKRPCSSQETQLTIKGWENKERETSNKNEEKGECEQKESSRVEFAVLWNEWSRKTNQFHSLFHKTWFHPESG